MFLKLPSPLLSGCSAARNCSPQSARLRLEPLTSPGRMRRSPQLQDANRQTGLTPHLPRAEAPQPVRRNLQRAGHPIACSTHWGASSQAASCSLQPVMPPVDPSPLLGQTPVARKRSLQRARKSLTPLSSPGLTTRKPQLQAAGRTVACAAALRLRHASKTHQRTRTRVLGCSCKLASL